MSDEFIDIFEKPFRLPKTMTRNELKDEVVRWRNIWTWLQEDVQWWLTHINQEVVAMNRKFDRIEGTLGQPHFDLTSFDIEWVERLYNYSKGEATYEHKTTTLKPGDLSSFSVIHGKEVKAEKYGGEPLDAELEQLESLSQ